MPEIHQSPRMGDLTVGWLIGEAPAVLFDRRSADLFIYSPKTAHQIHERFGGSYKYKDLALTGSFPAEAELVALKGYRFGVYDSQCLSDLRQLSNSQLWSNADVDLLQMRANPGKYYLPISVTQEGVTEQLPVIYVEKVQDSRELAVALFTIDEMKRSAFASSSYVTKLESTFKLGSESEGNLQTISYVTPCGVGVWERLGPQALSWVHYVTAIRANCSLREYHQYGQISGQSIRQLAIAEERRAS